MCECYSTIKGKLVDHFKAKAPAGAGEIDVEIEGFLFGISDTGVTHRSSNPVVVRYTAPKKAGGTKKVVEKTFVRASYCPFCGEAYEKAEAADHAAADAKTTTSKE